MTMNGPRPNQSLRQARDERCWSQQKLADEVGVNKGTINRWEKRKSKPRPDELGRLCKALEKSREELGYPLELLVEASSEDGAGVSLSQEISVAPLVQDPLAGEKLSDDQEKLLSVPHDQPNQLRRLIVRGAVSVALVLASGSTAMWFLLSRPRESRQWPTVGYDLHHRKERVRVVQWMLKAHQVDIGPNSVDGIFGSNTQNAVIAFQQQQGFSGTGQVDGPTWEKIIISSDLGSTGSQVFALQECLNLALKFVHRLGVDGDFGPQTAEAVRQFRQQQHLPENGGADLNIWYLLVQQVGEMSPE